MSKRKSISIKGLEDKLQEISESIDNSGISTSGIEIELERIKESLVDLKCSINEIESVLYKIVGELAENRQHDEKWKKVKLISK